MTDYAPPGRNDQEVRDQDMPAKMKPQPGEGDLEESFQLMLPSFEPAGKMDVGIDDRGALDAVDRGERALIDDLDRQAQQGVVEAQADAADPVVDIDNPGGLDLNLDGALEPPAEGELDVSLDLE